MRFKSPPLAFRLILAGIVVVSCAAFLTARLSHSAAFSAEEKKRIWAEEAHLLVRAGLGSEVTLAGANAGPDEVRASIQSVTGFIRERSGLNLDQSATDRLAKMEQRTLNAEGRRITPDELGSLFVGVVMERIQNISDADLEQAADGFANVKIYRPLAQPEQQIPGGQAFPAAKCTRLPDKIMLRSTGQGIMSKEEFIRQVRDLRARLQSPAMLASLVGPVRQEAAKLITARVDGFAEALPGQWGQARRAGLTPVQALLVVYSTASDDRLWYSNAQLVQMMKRSETNLKEATGITVSSEGRHAYGSGGYIFSTPLGLALDLRTTSRILDLLEERSAK